MELSIPLFICNQIMYASDMIVLNLHFKLMWN